MNEVFHALLRRSGEATVAELAADTGEASADIRRWLRDREDVYEVVRDRFLLSRRRPLGSDRANELLGLLDERYLGIAHLTGFDCLVSHAHQFHFQWPHLVYCQPQSMSSVMFDVATAGWVAVRAKAMELPGALEVPELGQLVVVREQKNPEQYGAWTGLARPEKAWVDALRETRRGVLALDFLELGRMLASLERSGADEQALRRYATKMGYRTALDSAAASEPAPDTWLRALQTGFLS